LIYWITYLPDAAAPHQGGPVLMQLVVNTMATPEIHVNEVVSNPGMVVGVTTASTADTRHRFNKGVISVSKLEDC
jgi:hypothetical protein